MQGAGCGFIAGQERSTDLDGIGSEYERGRDSPAIADSARHDHRKAYCVAHLRQQREITHQDGVGGVQKGNPVPARLGACRHQHIDAGFLDRVRLVDGRRIANRHNAALLAGL